MERPPASASQAQQKQPPPPAASRGSAKLTAALAKGSSPAIGAGGARFTAALEQQRSGSASPAANAKFTAAIQALGSSPSAGLGNAVFDRALANPTLYTASAPGVTGPNRQFTLALARNDPAVMGNPEMNRLVQQLQAPSMKPPARQTDASAGPRLLSTNAREAAEHDRKMMAAMESAMELSRQAGTTPEKISEGIIQEVKRALGETFDENFVRSYAYRWFVQNRYRIARQVVVGVGVSIALNVLLPGVGAVVPGFSLLRYLANPAIGGNWMWSFTAGLAGAARTVAKDALVEVASKRLKGLPDLIPDVNLLGARRVQDTLEWLGVSEENRRISLRNALRRVVEASLTEAMKGKLLDRAVLGGVSWYVPTMSAQLWRGFAYSTAISSSTSGGLAMGEGALKNAMRQLGRGIARLGRAPIDLAARIQAAYARRREINSRVSALLAEVRTGSRSFASEEAFGAELAAAMELDSNDPTVVRTAQEVWNEVVEEVVQELDEELDAEDMEQPVELEAVARAAERPAAPPAVEAQNDETRFRLSASAVATSLASAAVTLTGALLLSRMAPNNFELAGELMAPLGSGVTSLMQDIAATSGFRIETLFYQLVAQGIDADALLTEYGSKIPIHRFRLLQQLVDRARNSFASGSVEDRTRVSRELMSILLGDRLYTRRELERLSSRELRDLFAQLYGPTGQAQLSGSTTDAQLIDAIVRQQSQNISNVHVSFTRALTKPVVTQVATSAVAATAENGYAAARGVYVSILDNADLSRLAGLTELGRDSLRRFVENPSLDPLGAFQPGALGSAAMEYMRDTGNVAIDAAMEAKATLDAWIKRGVETLSARQAGVSSGPLQQQQQPILSAPLSQQALADANAIAQGFENAQAMRAALDNARAANAPFRVGANRYENYTDYLKDQAEQLARAAQNDADRAAVEAERARAAYERREAELAAIRRGEFGTGPRISDAQRAFDQARRASAQRINDGLKRAADTMAASPGMNQAMANALAGLEALQALLVGPSGVVGLASAPGFTPAVSPADFAPQPMTPSYERPPPQPKPEPKTPAMEELEGIYWQPLADTLERGALNLAEGYAESLLLGALGASTAGVAFAPTLLRAGASGFNYAADIYSIARAVVQATDISPDSMLRSLPAVNVRLPEIPSLVSWLYSSEAVRLAQRQREIDVRAEVAAAVGSYAFDASLGNSRTPMSLVMDIAGRLIGPPSPMITGMAAQQVADATRSLAKAIASVSGIEWKEP